MDRKDAEVEGLRKELEDIRRELKGQQAEREKLKQKSKPVPKPVD